jgi:peptide deformylase
MPVRFQQREPLSIITIPNPLLRAKAAAVPVSEWSTTMLGDLAEALLVTLVNKSDPPGVGLAAPQVAKSWRAFATLLPDRQHGARDRRSKRRARVFVNPEIIATDETFVLGLDPHDPDLEGCLSMPGIYGAVPRYREITVRFLELEVVKGVVVGMHQAEETFRDFPARVMQHELDHLDGILFTDHSTFSGLPIYKEDEKTKKLREISIDALGEF